MALAVAALGSVSAAPVFAQGTPELPRYQLDTDTFPTARAGS